MAVVLGVETRAAEREDRAAEREDRREQQRREDLRVDREERQEARRAGQAAHLQTPPAASVDPNSTAGFQSNKAFATLPTFGGAHFRAWQEEFMSKASIVGVHHDNLRELRLKLTGDARAHYHRKYTETCNPPLLEAMAHLASEFAIKYGESKLWGDVYRLKRKPGSSGRAFMRTLAANRKRMLDAGIPAVRSEAEDMYYLHELNLRPDQLPVFLAQLSANADVSDSHLQSITGTTYGPRRDSFAPAEVSSAARTKLFELRLQRIVAFLEHGLVDTSPDGTARAAATTGLSSDPDEPPHTPPGSPASTPPATREDDREARCCACREARLAKAAGTTTRNHKPQAAPKYHGNDVARNEAEFARRRAAGACFHCPNDMVDHTLRFTLCPTHGTKSKAEDRFDPKKYVEGSGSRFK